MAAIGPGWSVAAWVQASWIGEAWSAVGSVLGSVLLGFRRRRRF